MAKSAAGSGATRRFASAEGGDTGETRKAAGGATERVYGGGATIPPFATIASWCELTGMSRRSVYRAIGRGDVVARKAGRATLVETAPSLAWLRSLPSAQVKPEVASVCARTCRDVPKEQASQLPVFAA